MIFLFCAKLNLTIEWFEPCKTGVGNWSNENDSEDLGEKKYIYAQSGIQEYWISNLQNQQLYVFFNLA